MTASIEIKRKRGDTRRIVIDIVQDGLPVDLSSWSGFLLTVDRSKEPVDASTKAEQMVGIIGSAEDGRVYFVPSGAVAAGWYFYDAQGIDENGEKITICEGPYKVTQDITKD